MCPDSRKTTIHISDSNTESESDVSDHFKITAIKKPSPLQLSPIGLYMMTVKFGICYPVDYIFTPDEIDKIKYIPKYSDKRVQIGNNNYWVKLIGASPTNNLFLREIKSNTTTEDTITLHTWNQRTDDMKKEISNLPAIIDNQVIVPNHGTVDVKTSTYTVLDDPKLVDTILMSDDKAASFVNYATKTDAVSGLKVPQKRYVKFIYSNTKTMTMYDTFFDSVTEEDASGNRVFKIQSEIMTSFQTLEIVESFVSTELRRVDLILMSNSTNDPFNSPPLTALQSPRDSSPLGLRYAILVSRNRMQINNNICLRSNIFTDQLKMTITGNTITLPLRNNSENWNQDFIVESHNIGTNYYTGLTSNTNIVIANLISPIDGTLIAIPNNTSISDQSVILYGPLISFYEGATQNFRTYIDTFFEINKLHNVNGTFIEFISTTSTVPFKCIPITDYPTDETPEPLLYNTNAEFNLDDFPKSRMKFFRGPNSIQGVNTVYDDGSMGTDQSNPFNADELLKIEIHRTFTTMEDLRREFIVNLFATTLTYLNLDSSKLKWNTVENKWTMEITKYHPTNPTGPFSHEINFVTTVGTNSDGDEYFYTNAADNNIDQDYFTFSSASADNLKVESIMVNQSDANNDTVWEDLTALTNDDTLILNDTFLSASQIYFTTERTHTQPDGDFVKEAFDVIIAKLPITHVRCNFLPREFVRITIPPSDQKKMVIDFKQDEDNCVLDFEPNPLEITFNNTVPNTQYNKLNTSLYAPYNYTIEEGVDKDRPTAIIHIGNERNIEGGQTQIVSNPWDRRIDFEFEHRVNRFDIQLAFDPIMEQTMLNNN